MRSKATQERGHEVAADHQGYNDTEILLSFYLPKWYDNKQDGFFMYVISKHERAVGT